MHLDANVGVHSEPKEEQTSDEDGEDADALEHQFQVETDATVCKEVDRKREN